MNTNTYVLIHNTDTLVLYYPNPNPNPQAREGISRSPLIWRVLRAFHALFWIANDRSATQDKEREKWKHPSVSQIGSDPKGFTLPSPDPLDPGCRSRTYILRYQYGPTAYRLRPFGVNPPGPTVVLFVL